MIPLDTRISAIACALEEKYGYTHLTLREVAAELRRDAGGLAYVFKSRRKRSRPWAARLFVGRSVLGHRPLFAVGAVARCLVLGDDPLSPAEAEAYLLAEARLREKGATGAATPAAAHE